MPTQITTFSSAPLLYSPCCTLCTEPSVTRSVHKPTGIDNTAPSLESTDGAEVGERRGTSIPTPVGYRSRNASLKLIQKTEPTDKKKNESDDVLCTTLTLLPGINSLFSQSSSLTLSVSLLPLGFAGRWLSLCHCLTCLSLIASPVTGWPPRCHQPLHR